MKDKLPKAFKAEGPSIPRTWPVIRNLGREVAAARHARGQALSLL